MRAFKHSSSIVLLYTFLMYLSDVFALSTPALVTGQRSNMLRWINPQSQVKHHMNLWIDSDILICLLSRSSNALRVSTGHKPIYEEYLELHVLIYEWVHRWTFHSCALRAANDENRIGGWSTLRMICMFGNMFALLNGCWSVVSRVAGLLSSSIYCLCPSFLGLRQSHGTFIVF